MLDQAHEQSRVAEWIAALPCHVKIPSAWSANFEKRGVATTAYADARRFPRMWCRGEHCRAALEYCGSLPALPREPSWHGVYTTNMSRGGCGFLHSEPLYPSERMRLLFASGLEQPFEVAWCRRIDELCFEVGARFVT